MSKKEAKDVFFDFKKKIYNDNSFVLTRTWGNSQGLFIRFETTKKYHTHQINAHQFNLRLTNNNKIVVNYVGPGKGKNRVVYQSAYSKVNYNDLTQAINNFLTNQ